MIFLLIKIILALAVLGALVVAVYIALQGDAEMHFKVKERTMARMVKADSDHLEFEVDVPYDNTGKQEGTILDTYMRIYLPQEQYGDVLLRGKVNLKSVFRDDDYFEALLVPGGTGDVLTLRFEAYPKNGVDLKTAVANLPDVDVALFADCRGRKELYTVREYLTLTSQEFKSLVQ